MKSLNSLALTAALGLLISHSALADTAYWNLSGSSSWNTLGNWSTNSDGTGSISVVPGAGDTATFNSSPINANVTAALTGSISLGGLVINNSGTTSIRTDGVADRTITLGSGGITVNSGAGAVNIGVNATNQKVYFALSATQSWINNGTGLFNLPSGNAAGSINLGSYQLTFGGSGDFSSAGYITGTGGVVRKTGAGTLTVSAGSSFIGAILEGGIWDAVNFANVNTNSSFGKGSAAGSAADLVIAGGTLRHTAANVASTDRLFTIGNANGLTATIESSAASAVNTVSFTGTGQLAYGGTGARTLTLTGSNSGNNTFNSIVGDGTGGATSLVKSGTGTWSIGAANTFTGNTTVNAGTLILSNSLALQSSVFDTSASVAGDANNGLKTTVTALTLGGLSGTKNFASTGGVFTTSSGGYSNVTALTLNVGSGTTTYSGVIENGASGMNLAKSGVGIQVLSGNNSFTGDLSVNQGTLSVNSIANSGTNSALGAGGTINIGSGSTTAGALLFTGSGGSTNRTINLAATTTGGATITHNGTNGGSGLVFTGSFSNAGTSGTKTFTLNGSNTDTGNEFRSVISNGSGGTLTVVKSQGGFWALTGNNSFTGDLFINQGTLSANSIANSGSNSALGAGSTISLGSSTTANGALTYTGTGGSTNRTIILAATTTGAGTITHNGSGALVFTGSFSNAGTSGTKIFTLNGTNTDAGNEFRSVISNGSGGTLNVVKGNTGAWTLSGNNSFTGDLSINQGTLSVTSIADTGFSSALGAGTAINIGSSTTNAGTLNYTGTGGATNRTINLAATTTGAATINSNGSGAMVLTGVLNNAGTGAKTLTLGGTNTGSNEFRGAIGNGSGTLSLAKANTGAWTLSGSNTYTGNTTVSAGALLVDGRIASGSAVSVLANAVIGGKGTIAGNLTLANDALFAFDTTNTLTLEGSFSFNLSFGVASLRDRSGAAVNWSGIADGSYKLIQTSYAFNASNITNFGEANAYNIGDGRTAYFQNDGLSLMVVPEPSVAGLLTTVMIGAALLRRRRA